MSTAPSAKNISSRENIPPPPHRALLVDDIVREIVGHLRPQRHCDSDSRLVLASLARVCKQFSEPALDVLWRHLHDWHVILRLLPSSYYVTSGDTHSEGNLTRPCNVHYLNYDIVLDEWERLQIHARRVRHLSPFGRNPDVDDILDPSVFRALAQECRGQPLFPLLQVIIWDQCPLSKEQQILISPRLLSIHVFIGISFNGIRWLKNRPADARVEVVFMESLLRQASRLRNLTLAGASITSPALDTVAKFRHLDCLAVWFREADRSVATPRFVQSLSTMQNLKRLTLECGNLPAEVIQIVELPALDDVQLKGTFPTINCVLEALCAPRLRTIRLHPSLLDADDPKDVRGSFEIMASQFHSSLENVQVTYHFHQDPSPSFTPVALLRPLFKVSRLKSFGLYPVGDVNGSLDDDDLDLMARSWPLLQDLDVKRFRKRPSASIACLSSFARYCPALKELNLHIVYVREKLEKSKFPQLHHKLECICLHLAGNYAEDSLFSLAEFLNGLFPYLDLVRCRKEADRLEFDFDTEEDHVKWGGVISFLVGMRKVGWELESEEEDGAEA